MSLNKLLVRVPRRELVKKFIILNYDAVYYKMQHNQAGTEIARKEERRIPFQLMSDLQTETHDIYMCGDTSQPFEHEGLSAQNITFDDYANFEVLANWVSGKCKVYVVDTKKNTKVVNLEDVNVLFHVFDKEIGNFIKRQEKYEYTIGNGTYKQPQDPSQALSQALDDAIIDYMLEEFGDQEVK